MRSEGPRPVEDTTANTKSRRSFGRWIPWGLFAAGLAICVALVALDVYARTHHKPHQPEAVPQYLLDGAAIAAGVLTLLAPVLILVTGAQTEGAADRRHQQMLDRQEIAERHAEARHEELVGAQRAIEARLEELAVQTRRKPALQIGFVDDDGRPVTTLRVKRRLTKEGPRKSGGMIVLGGLPGQRGAAREVYGPGGPRYEADLTRTAIRFRITNSGTAHATEVRAYIRIPEGCETFEDSGATDALLAVFPNRPEPTSGGPFVDHNSKGDFGELWLWADDIGHGLGCDFNDEAYVRFPRDGGTYPFSCSLRCKELTEQIMQELTVEVVPQSPERRE